jgi:DNA-binding transcriptional ArsR family regulator
MTTESMELIDKDEHIEQASRALKAMSHPLRLKILCVLGDKEVSVQDIVENVGTSQSNISQHLAILRDKGVLRTRKGRQPGVLPGGRYPHPATHRHDARRVLRIREIMAS